MDYSWCFQQVNKNHYGYPSAMWLLVRQFLCHSELRTWAFVGGNERLGVAYKYSYRKFGESTISELIFGVCKLFVTWNIPSCVSVSHSQYFTVSTLQSVPYCQYLTVSTLQSVPHSQYLIVIISQLVPYSQYLIVSISQLVPYSQYLTISTLLSVSHS
jgi:hypothetical protein